MVKKLLSIVALALIVLGTPHAVLALDDGESDACATDLLNCYGAAAKIDSFWYRWAAGLDCELDYVECVRVKLIGV